MNATMMILVQITQIHFLKTNVIKINKSIIICQKNKFLKAWIV